MRIMQYSHTWQIERIFNTTKILWKIKINQLPKFKIFYRLNK